MKKVQRSLCGSQLARIASGGLTGGENCAVRNRWSFDLALQFALLGAKAIITSSSDEKLACLRTADETINYKAFQLEEKVYELTQRQGVDQVIEVGAQALENLCARSV